MSIYTDEQARQVLLARDWSTESANLIIEHRLDPDTDHWLRRMLRVRQPRRPAPARKEPISYRLRKQVFERDAYRCVTCGDWHNLEADNIVPESLGGPTTLDNLQTMCQPCNGRKGNRQ